MSPKRLEDMYDAVIVGAGAAGLSAALGLLRSPEITELKEQGVDPKILVVSKLQPLRSAHRFSRGRHRREPGQCGVR